METAPERIRASVVLRLAVVVLFFTAAPTAGDIGSCGQPPDDLDAEKYFIVEKSTDCSKCMACELITEPCKLACKPGLVSPFDFFATPDSAQCRQCLSDELTTSACRAACDPCKLSNQGCEKANECCSYGSQVLMPLEPQGDRACNDGICTAVQFLKDCYPIVHDGEACLNALKASSCDDYRLYMSDGEPTIPTECNVCPPCIPDGGTADGAVDLPRCD